MLLVRLDGGMWVRRGLSARARPRRRWRTAEKGGKRGSRDGGRSGPIHILEGLEAKQMSSVGGRTRPEVLGGEVAAGRSGAAHGCGVSAYQEAWDAW
jgi:hypothetical protein